jgi:metal-responsive CopG/Arc/MetJ family transcriptional regulator
MPRTTRKRQLNVLLSGEEFRELDELAVERGVNRSYVIRLLIRREREAADWLSPLERAAALGRAVGGAMKTKKRRKLS